MERDETDGNVDQFLSLQTCFVRQNVICFFFHRATFTAWCTGYIFAGVYRICASGRGVLPGISPLPPCQKKVRPSLLFLLFSLAEKWKRRMLKKNIQNANSHRRPKNLFSPSFGLQAQKERKRDEKELPDFSTRFLKSVQTRMNTVPL